MKNVDFRNGRPLVMMVSQYDFGYNLQVALWSNGTPVTITAAEIVSENFTTTCTFSGNVVTIPISTSMTERFGHFPAEMRVTDSTGQVSSKNFDFFVERSPLAVKSSETYSGDIVEFTAKRVPLSSVVVTMEPIQSGSGDPSPTNVRPITGRTGASVLVNSEYSETGATTYPITFTSAGTVYAGTVDLVSGVLTVTHGLINAKNYTWRGTAGVGVYASLSSTADQSTRTEIWCNIAKYMNIQSPGSYDNVCYWGGTVASDTNNGNLVIVSRAYTSNSADWNTYIANNDVQICYKLATPTTYTLTPTQVMSLLGENVVWSPDGEVTVVVPEYY